MQEYKKLPSVCIRREQFYWVVLATEPFPPMNQPTPRLTCDHILTWLFTLPFFVTFLLLQVSAEMSQSLNPIWIPVCKSAPREYDPRQGYRGKLFNKAHLPLAEVLVTVTCCCPPWLTAHAISVEFPYSPHGMILGMAPSEWFKPGNQVPWYLGNLPCLTCRLPHCWPLFSQLLCCLHTASPPIFRELWIGSEYQLLISEMFPNLGYSCKTSRLLSSNSAQRGSGREDRNAKTFYRPECSFPGNKTLVSHLVLSLQSLLGSSLPWLVG